jgi:hypothetical protein
VLFLQCLGALFEVFDAAMPPPSNFFLSFPHICSILSVAMNSRAIIIIYAFPVIPSFNNNGGSVIGSSAFSTA